MKSALSTSNTKEIDDTAMSSARVVENARKVQKMLRKRRELMAAQGKLRVDEKKPQKSGDLKDISNQKSEPTSEEYDDEDEEHPELTLTENSESYDSNDSLRGIALAKELDKG